MDASHYRDRFADVDPGEEEYWKIQSEIDFASGDCSGKVVCRRIHIAHIGKAFGSQQLIRDIERRLADREVLRNPDCGRTPRCPASGTATSTPPYGNNRRPSFSPVIDARAAAVYAFQPRVSKA